MYLELYPHVSVGPARIGEELAVVVESLRNLPGYIEPDPLLPHQPGLVSFASGLSFSLHSYGDGKIVAIEVFGSDEDTVLLNGMDVFKTSADEVTAFFAARTKTRNEEDGGLMVMPELAVALWRDVVPEFPGDEEGKFFKSVTVARPGYFSLPDD